MLGVKISNFGIYYYRHLLCAVCIDYVQKGRKGSRALDTVQLICNNRADMKKEGCCDVDLFDNPYYKLFIFADLSNACDATWSNSGPNCYKLFEDSVNVATATARCRDDQEAELTPLDSPAEKAFIVAMIQNSLVFKVHD